MKHLTLLVTYTTKPEMQEAFLHSIMESGILEKVRKEDGCLRYEYYSSVEDENQILLVEEWSSEEQQKIHLEQPHMAELKELKEKYVIDTKVKKFSS